MQVSLQLGQLAEPVQELGRNWLQVEVASTAVLEAKLVAKVMGGKSPGEVRVPSCWPAAEGRHSSADSASKRAVRTGDSIAGNTATNTKQRFTGVI